MEKDKDSLIRLIKSTAESIKLITVDREFTKKVITKWMPIKDADLLEQVYRFATENYAKEGIVPEGALGVHAERADRGVRVREGFPQEVRPPLEVQLVRPSRGTRHMTGS